MGRSGLISGVFWELGRFVFLYLSYSGYILICELYKQATLLLPLDPVTSPDRTIAITPEFVKDHVVLCDLPTGGGAGAAVTLSGLRGILHSDR